jgi:hypothetical protein
MFNIQQSYSNFKIVMKQELLLNPKTIKDYLY